jgi:hypothetical protein
VVLQWAGQSWAWESAHLGPSKSNRQICKVERTLKPTRPRRRELALLLVPGKPWRRVSAPSPDPPLRPSYDQQPAGAPLLPYPAPSPPSPGMGAVKMAIASENVSPLDIRLAEVSCWCRAPTVARQMALARSLQPLHTAVSAARLTSRLGAEVARAVSQGTLCSSYPGV